MPTSRLQNYLASDEELLLSFSAENVLRRGSDDGESFSQTLESAQFDSDYEFGATDRRIVYVTGTGGFKDIEYSHISSIESATETDNSEQLGAFVLGCCGGILALGGLTSIGDKPGTALFGIILGGFSFCRSSQSISKRKLINKTESKIHYGRRSISKDRSHPLI